ncbi:hypothetical protein LY13_000540 [Prauserella aidingensis]|uniref:TadE family type IV pilus minor pilin n=1 Tax=Prauserella aidingensis TaxID=387890 RepID=UPI0020A4BD4A|nr:TadE family type IV pilus minor pilin [Prauserella aidingensis]MCP2251809.1 hypothetical protein [Prauserella aidingensis]
MPGVVSDVETCGRDGTAERAGAEKPDSGEHHDGEHGGGGHGSGEHGDAARHGGGIAGDDRGSVTVEGAITVCSLIVALGLVLGVVTAVLAQVRCADAAGEAARLLGRGDDARAREAFRSLAPDGATLTSQGDGTGIAVTVRSPILDGMLPGIELSAEAYAVREPETGGVGANGAPE